MNWRNGIFVLFSLIFISGCQSADKIPEFISSPEDVVNKPNGIQNIERFEQFLSNMKEGKEDEVRIVHYTIEGDPILHVLEYDGEIIHSTYDTRRDKYGQGSVSQTTCSSIEEIQTGEDTEYNLEGSGNSEVNIILTVQE
ncbi:MULTISPECIES: DUF4362 domain-containing protein [Bacillales]|mgnify:CR=1 FL=1|uniref:DUF4362 domain-containing protein n=1 Tax=Lysinibacillus halotolerans TaxID=1368476 RepID=A0A3M8H5E9_9BACI|nr:DUF4362 domain-containing protein [Lysinibacillus halotolerans]RNC97636.1 DUF4362 domain-containing protein [Lysinibacillus halotolerans]